MHIREYIRELNNTGLAAKSIARIISSIRSYHNFLSSEKIIKENPALNLDSPKIPKKLPEVLSEIEISNITESIDDSYQFAKRDKAIIEMLYSCGIRVTELCESRDLSNLFFDDDLIRVYGKGSKERLLPIGGRAKRFLNDYLLHTRHKLDKKQVLVCIFSRNGKPLTRAMINNILKKWCLVSGITNLFRRIHYAIHLPRTF